MEIATHCTALTSLSFEHTATSPALPGDPAAEAQQHEAVSLLETAVGEVAQAFGERLVSLDILKSSGIVMVLLLHTTQEAVDQGKYFGGLEALPILYIGGMSGLFFVLNSLDRVIFYYRYIYLKESNFILGL